ncbi:MAG TPA: hypothetical protein VFH31_12150, partial [Pyrinomonadaceae bacterium]|nr:hypothetical protein [Pyrinomonadaceae bacterium]
HGDRVIQQMLNRKFDYGIAEENIPLLNDSYRKKGFSFAHYPSAADYGIPLTTPEGFGFADESATDYGVSLTTPEWIRTEAAKLGLNEVYFREHGWDDHQDVYGFVKPRKPHEII